MQSESIVCKSCTKTYSSYTSFRRHIEYGRCKSSATEKQATKPAVEKPGQVTCPKCSKPFSNIYNLKRHTDTACKSNRVKHLLNNPDGHAMMERMFEMMLTHGTHNTTNNNMGTINNSTENNSSTNTLNQSNQINNNNLNLNQCININPLGQENLDHISEDRRIAILKKGINAVGALYEAILEDPANHNLVVVDKRNKKVLYKNRDSKMAIGDLKKVVNTVATETIDRIDDFLGKYHDKLSRKDKTILRLIQAQGFVFPGEEADESQDEADEALFDDYHTRCEELIMDLLELNKGRISKRLKKYMASLEAIEE